MRWQDQAEVMLFADARVLPLVIDIAAANHAEVDLTEPFNGPKTAESYVANDAAGRSNEPSAGDASGSRRDRDKSAPGSGRRWPA